MIVFTYISIYNKRRFHMTIRHLTVFVAVAEQGSMSAAAKHSVRPSGSWKLIITAFSLNVLEKSFISQNGESFFFPMPVK